MFDGIIEEQQEQITSYDTILQTSEIYTIKNALFISPFEWELNIPGKVSGVRTFAKDELISLEQYQYKEKYEDPPGSGLYTIPQDGVKVISTEGTEITFNKMGEDAGFVYYETWINVDDGYDFDDIVCPLDYDAIPQNDLVYILSHMHNVGATKTAEEHLLRICPLVLYPYTPGDTSHLGPINDFYKKNYPGVTMEHREIDASKLNSALASKAIVYDLLVNYTYFTDKVGLSSSNEKPLLMYLCSCHSKVWSEYFINHGVKLYLGNKHLLTYAAWEIPLSYYLFSYMLYGWLSPLSAPVDVEGYSSWSTGIPGNPDWTPPETPMDTYDALMTLKYYNVNPASFWTYWGGKSSEVNPYYNGVYCPKIYFQGNAEITVTEE